MWCRLGAGGFRGILNSMPGLNTKRRTRSPRRPNFRRRLVWEPGPRFEAALQREAMGIVEWEWHGYRWGCPAFFISGYLGDRVWLVHGLTPFEYIHRLYRLGLCFELRRPMVSGTMPPRYLFSVRVWESLTEYERGAVIECRFPVARARERARVIAGTPIPRYFADDESWPSV